MYVGHFLAHWCIASIRWPSKVAAGGGGGCGGCGGGDGGR